MKGKPILKSLLCSYGVTAIMLFLLAFLLFKFDLSQNMVGAGVTVIYIISCFLGGFVLGRSAGRQKYVWGIALGIIYFLLLTAVSWIVERQTGINGGRMITTLALCMGSGMLGGMLS